MTAARILAVLLLTALHASAGDPRVENFRLLDQNGVSRELYRNRDAKAVVLLVHGNGCPIFTKSVAEINALRARFAKRGVVFLGLNANSQDSRESIAKAAVKAGLDFPILVDESQMIAKSLGITRTAEAFVIDPKSWTVKYRGAIDDRLYYGAEKPAAAKHYLADALEAVLAGKAPAVPATEAFGCLIGFESAKGRTYTEDAAPILREKCQRCHLRDDDPAPLTGFKAVRGWAPMIRETVRTGLMPPNAADAHAGALGENPALTAEQTRVLLQWLESDLARGEGGDLLEKSAAAADRWRGQKPDLVYEAEVPNLPDDPARPFRFVTLAPALERDLWISGAVVAKEGPSQNLLHDDLVVDRPGAPVDALKTSIPDLAERSLTLDYNPYLLRVNPTFSRGAVQFFPKGAKLVLKIHYPYAALTKPGKVKLAYGLFLDRAPGAPGRLLSVPLRKKDLRIPPEDPAYFAEASYTLDKPVSLRCLRFHAHRRGSSMRISARAPGGSAQDLLSVPFIDYHAGALYCLDAPKRLAAGTVVTARGGFDNSAKNPNNPDPSKPVAFGFGDAQEMLEAWLYFTADGG